MNRKKFLTSLSAVSAGASVFPYSIFVKSQTLKRRNNVNYFADEPAVIKPARLKSGDKLAVVSPGSYISENELQDSVKNLNQLGFETTYSGKVLLQSGYLAGSDRERADDLMEKFSDKSIKGIVCSRGGYGCARILPFLDYDVIRSNPKVLIGYSDVTALLYGIFKKSNLITFHGPVGISSFNDYSVNNFNKVLLNPANNTVLYNSGSGEDENIYGVTSIVEGKARGRMIGGNLSIMISLIGTEFDVDYSGKIVFLEEVEEEPYRVDRMLTQLIQTGKFDNAAAIMLGIFKKCVAKENSDLTAKSFTLMEVLSDRLGTLKIPVIYGMSFGHVKDKLTIPFGVYAEIDTYSQTLTLLESAVE